MRVLVTGAAGMLARAVVREFGGRGHDVVALDRGALDVTDEAAVGRVVTGAAPDAVIQCAAYTRVDDAEREDQLAFEGNVLGALFVAQACAECGARFVYPSTDYVFDGTGHRPYRPDDRTAPVNTYGHSKLLGEKAALVAADTLVVRTSWLYGAGGRNFVSTMLERARAGAPLRVVNDQRGSPTWTGSLARTLALLLERGAPAGVYHATDAGETTWWGLATEAIRRAGMEPDVEPVSSDAFPRPAARPAYSVLDCSATEAVVGPLPDWREALARAVPELEAAGV